MRKLLSRYRELISYGFWGVATTLVNYGMYLLCTRPLKLDLLPAQGIAWAVSVAFAFVVNKLLVFRSTSWSRETALREAWQFVSARILSGLVETALLWVFVRMLRFDDRIVKLAANVVVILMNYVLSKLIIFRKGTEKHFPPSGGDS